MTQGHTIDTHARNIHVEIRLDGEVVASSDRPVVLEETGLPTTYYLPRADVLADLQGIELSTHCPFKGDASYWTIRVEDRNHDGIAWSYEDPKARGRGDQGPRGVLCRPGPGRRRRHPLSGDAGYPAEPRWAQAPGTT